MAVFDADERFLVNKFGESYLYSLNGETFNQFGSRFVFDERYGAALFEKNTLYFIVGSDSGLLPRYIESKGVPEGSRYWFIEPPWLIGRVADNAALASARVQFATLPEALAKADKQTDLGAAYYAYQNKIQIYLSLGASNDLTGLYDGYRFALKEQIAHFAHHVKVSINVKPHIANHILNGPDTHTSAAFLHELFAGKTAVILAAGPSLDEYIDWVKAHRDRLIVIAISRISRRLRQVDLLPDVIVSVDPTAMSFDISKDMLAMPETLFVFSANATPKLVSQWGGRCAYLGKRFPWQSDLNEANCPTMGPSVSNTAINLAHWMGCRQIVLLGMDSCYSQQGETYAKGSTEREIGMSFEYEFVKVPTNHGGEAYTNHDFLQQIDSLVDQAAYLTSLGVRVITPVAGAARIDNIDYVPAGDIELGHLPMSASDRIGQEYAQVQDAAFLVRLKAEYLEVVESIDALIGHAQAALAELGGQDVGARRPPAAFCPEKIKALQDMMAKERISQTVKDFGWYRFMPISEILDGAGGGGDVARQAFAKYFETYAEAAREMRGLVMDGLRSAEMRQAELSDSPDLDMLIEHWRYFGQYGRAGIWADAKACLMNGLSESQARVFSDFAAKFDAELGSTDTQHSAYMRDEAKIENSLPIIKRAFDDRNTSLLGFLVTALKTHKSAQARAYLMLARGLKCTLDQQYDQALGWFEQIIEAGESPLLRLALEQVAFISIRTGDTQNALSALECLAHLAESYQPIYAEALAAAGCADGALQTFDFYLKSHPNDVAALLRKCAALSQYGRCDDLRAAADAVLRIDPDNMYAREFMAEVAGHGREG